ncbi:S41 family peptidase [Embleya scabrispora]|uniref:S41 family peptidase n=1 Tax=Embleya scabrispora TaxID=159449 RepID=UPI00036EED68|nr:S41 family peptidase [Embleya scabrispora]MYS82023.1 PDZ domain-containing protein [Streptomyces sp. SID5474]
MTSALARPARHRRRRRSTGIAASGLALLLGTGVVTYADPFGSTAQAASSVPPCVAQDDNASEPGPPSAPQATTTTTIQQVYECIYANSYYGPAIDSREMLASAFKYLTGELQRRNTDRPTATMPKLTGNKGRDWEAFATTYEALLGTLPDDAALRQAVAAETIKGLIEYLRENHAGWIKGQPGAGGAPRYTLGITESPSGRPTPDMRDAQPPFFIKTVGPGSPAEKAGLKPGDILTTVNDVPVVVNGALTPGAVDWLHPRGADKVRLTVQRPSTGKTLTVELQAAVEQPPASEKATITLLPGGLAKVNLPSFHPGSADDVLNQIAKLRETTQLRGLVIDVRGNTGGRGEDVIKLLSAFVHGKVTSNECGLRKCTANHTDDTVPLLNLPMTLLTDGLCASACEDFTSAVKDIGIGKIVGGRTAGKISGKPIPYLLNDNSVLLLPMKHHASANGQVINEIGVAVDHEIPTTAQDLSAGRDPALEKATQLLTT